MKENLVVGGYSRPKERTREGLDRVLEVFPRLGERLGQLAGLVDQFGLGSQLLSAITIRRIYTYQQVFIG